MRVTGFPSPADEYGVVNLSLHELLIPRPTSTFFVRVVEDLAPNVRAQDILIVDRSLPAVHGALVLVVLQGQFHLRRLLKERGELWLHSLTKSPPLKLREDDETLLWGVVAHVIHRTLVA